MLIVGGCGNSAHDSEPDDAVPENTAQPSAALAESLADQEVSYDDYLAGFERFSSCMESEGYPLLIGDEVNMVVDYSVVEAAVVNGIEEYCYGREFEPLDVSWQIQREDTSEGAEMIRVCLRENGIDPAQTMAELTQQLESAGIATETCLGY